MGSSKRTEIPEIFLRLPSALGDVLVTLGAKVSGTKLKVRLFEIVLLPPVSVART